MFAKSRVVTGLLVMACAFGLLPASAFGERALGLLNGSMRYSLDPGESVSGFIEAVNDGDEPLVVKVYAAGQRFDEHGAVDYSVPTANRVLVAEAASWIELRAPKADAGDRSFTLAPGEKLPVGFTVTVPGGAAAGDHSIVVFFETTEGASGESGTRVTGRLGARIKVRTSGRIVERFTLDLFDIPACVIGNEVPYRFVFANKGNVDATATVTLETLERGGSSGGESQLPSATVSYAGSVIESTGTAVFDSGSLGFYTLRMSGSADTGGESPQKLAEERAVFLIPLWVIIAFIVLAVLAALAAVWNVAERKRRRKARERRRLRAEARQRELGHPTVRQAEDDQSESA